MVRSNLPVSESVTVGYVIGKREKVIEKEKKVWYNDYVILPVRKENLL